MSFCLCVLVSAHSQKNSEEKSLLASSVNACHHTSGSSFVENEVTSYKERQLVRRGRNTKDFLIAAYSS